MPLVMNTNDTLRTVEIWLDNSEAQNPDLLSELRSMCPVIRKTGYEVIIYKSGTKDLKESTRELVRSNVETRAGKFTNPALQ